MLATKNKVAKNFALSITKAVGLHHQNKMVGIMALMSYLHSLSKIGLEDRA